MARERTVYAVRNPEGGIVALVSTWESRMAVNHVAKATLSASRATQQEMYEAGKLGIEVQSTPTSSDDPSPGGSSEGSERSGHLAA